MIFVLSHTHWDREWFATSKYTRRLLLELFENLINLIEREPSFEYILDGQTLILEDLESEDHSLFEKALNYIATGNIKVGPIYAQLDWRISIPQAIWKNFEIGVNDCRTFGNCLNAGWFMDNFGQISQIPQILNKFGIKYAFVWRGLRKTDTFFTWRSPDGSSVRTHGLIGGYRTLYNLSDTKSMAKERFHHEFRKLKRFGDIVVLMDGYDLDTHPENPKEFLDEEFSGSISDLLEAMSRIDNLSIVEGELISGKIASVFPGTLSTRTYLKLGADHLGKLLTTLEFVQNALGRPETDQMWRDYLKTLIHDNICGVGVDQIHGGMERTYLNLFEEIKQDLKKFLKNFDMKGEYVFSPSKFFGAFPWKDEILMVNSSGIGFWKLERHRYFEKDLKDFKPFEIVLEKELGDAYSSDCEKAPYEVKTKVVKTLQSDISQRYIFQRKIKSSYAEIEILETYDVTDKDVWLRAEVNPKGCCYKLYYSFNFSGEILAGMPFDIVKRPCQDTDLYPEEETLGGILLAAREVGKIEEFPFQEFLTDSEKALVVKGLRSYVCREGRILIPILRSVEWITKKVRGRSGDAGPKMYVPGARSERKINLQIVLTQYGSDTISRAIFMNWPKVLVRAFGKNSKDVFLAESGSFLPGISMRGKSIEKVRIQKIKSGKSGRSQIDLEVEDLPYGNDKSTPDRKILRDMEREVKEIEEVLKGIQDSLRDLSGIEKVRAEHRYWTLLRKKLEIELSILLNRERLGESIDIWKIVKDLNEVRRKKRTYDYILELWEAEF